MESMKKRPDTVLYIIALAGLIVAGIITTSIINAVKDNQSGTDIRAKAGVTNTLKFSGVVNSINDIDATIVVDNVQLSQESRSGKAVNYGSWTVTPPRTFSLSSAVPGSAITFTVNANEFSVSSKHVVASDIKIGR